MEEQATQLWGEIRRNQAAAPAVDPHDIEACEALLESYYMQVLSLSGLQVPEHAAQDCMHLVGRYILWADAAAASGSAVPPSCYWAPAAELQR